jgi:hypothetical protein
MQACGLLAMDLQEVMLLHQTSITQSVALNLKFLRFSLILR